MKLTVRDLFDIPILKNFKIVAGEGGLDREIVGTDILDFEFVKGIHLSRDQILDKNSLVLTSLLFAKDDPSAITSAIEKMNSLEISCVAYKTVLFSKLPQEALDYANKNDFPILEFGGDEFFEDIIAEIASILKDGEDVEALEHDISLIIDNELSVREENRIAKKINTNFNRYVKVFAVKDSVRKTDESIIQLVLKMHTLERIKRKAALCKYKDGYFIILSQDSNNAERFNALLTDILIAADIDKSMLCCGESTIKPISDGFGKAIREAYWASNIAELEKVQIKDYRDIGIYRLIVPEIHSQNFQSYMSEYLAPLSEDKSHLLETACEYILAKGDLDETSKRMFCHTNTIRYRLSKLHEILDETSNDKEFYENLSMAIRIYMLSQFL